MSDKYSFFRSYHDALKGLDDASYGRLVRVFSEYAFNDKEPVLEGIEKVVWELVKPNLIRSIAISESRTNAGSKGGKANSNKRKQIQTNGSKTKQTEAKPSGIGKGEGNGEDNDKSSSSCMVEIDDYDVKWKVVEEEWSKRCDHRKKGSPLKALPQGMLSKSDKNIIRQRLQDCMEEYKCPLEGAWNIIFTVLEIVSDNTEDNYLNDSSFKSSVDFGWLMEKKENFFKVYKRKFIKHE